MQDPLNISIPLQGVDTELPKLPDGDYLCQVVESCPKPNKDNTGYNWNLKLALINPATATDGRTINPNFPLFDLCALQAKEDSTDKEAFRRGIGERLDAIFGTDKTNRPDFNKDTWEAAVGKTVVATVYLDEYPKGSQQFNNKIRRLKKAPGA